MPGTSASRATEFSAKRGVSPRSKPECGTAITSCAPSARIFGTSACAVSRMSVVTTLPSRWPLSQSMICGGTKPITPTFIVCTAPASSLKRRSRIT